MKEENGILFWGKDVDSDYKVLVMKMDAQKREWIPWTVYNKNYFSI